MGWKTQSGSVFLFNYFAVQLNHLCILFAHTNSYINEFHYGILCALNIFYFIYLHYYTPIFFILLISSLFPTSSPFYFPFSLGVWV